MDKKLKCVRCDKKLHVFEAEYIYNGMSLCEEHHQEIKDAETVRKTKTLGFQP